jgi:inosine-uridine nucleoside N-ribohydrolase
MGGAVAGGNVTPVAEANIANDPEAARMVFTSGVPLTMVGLDVTHQTHLPEEDLEPLNRFTSR